MRLTHWVSFFLFFIWPLIFFCVIIQACYVLLRLSILLRNEIISSIEKVEKNKSYFSFSLNNIKGESSFIFHRLFVFFFKSNIKTVGLAHERKGKKKKKNPVNVLISLVWKEPTKHL